MVRNIILKNVKKTVKEKSERFNDLLETSCNQKFFIIFPIVTLLLYSIGVVLLSIIQNTQFKDICIFESNGPVLLAYILKTVIIITGLLIMCFIPGISWISGFLKKKILLSEFLVGSLIVNILLIIGSTTILKLAGISLTRKLLVIDIVLLTIIGMVLFNSKLKQLKIVYNRKKTISLFVTSLIAFIIIITIFHMRIFSSYDKYWPIEMGQSLDYQVFDSEDVTKEYVNWEKSKEGILKPLSQTPSIIYNNLSSSNKKTNIRFFICGNKKKVSIYNNDQLINKYTNPQMIIKFDRPGHQYPIWNKMIISENFVLIPGQNKIMFNFESDIEKIYICDVSNLNKIETMRHSKKGFIVGRFPDIMDIIEPLDVSNRLIADKFPTAQGFYSMVNPPLLYYWYFLIFGLLEYGAPSVYLLELIGFIGLFLLLCTIANKDTEKFILRSTVISFLLVFCYILISLSLPLMHTASGFFLFIALLGSYFLFSNRLSLALVFAICTILLRYEGFIFVFFTLISYWIVFRDKNFILKFISKFIVITGVFYLSFFVIIWLNGSLEFWWDILIERTEMLVSTSVGISFYLDRILQTSGWAMVSSCFLPLSFFLVDRKDKISVFYLLISIGYFLFILMLSPIRPYYLGPFVFTTAIVGSKIFTQIEKRNAKLLAYTCFLLLGGLSIYLIYYYLNIYISAGSEGTISFISYLQK